MDSYHYAAPSVLDEVIFVHTDKGGVRAYLQAAPNAKAHDLRQVVEALHDQRWGTVPYTLDGKPVLEVRGFDNPKKLLTRLEIAKAIHGEPEIEKTADEKQNLLGKLQKRSLQMSGLAYMVGDAAFIKYGYAEGSKLDVLGGILYGLGTMSLVLFGRNDQGDMQVHEHAKKLEKYFIKENVRIPDFCSLHSLADDKSQGIPGEAYDWAKSHPAELFNTIYVGAGACIAAAALKHKALAPPKIGETAKEIAQMRTEGWLDVGLGSCTTTSALIANLVQEKKRDPDDPLPKGALNKVFAWVQEKPMRVAGYGYMVSTMFHAVSTTVAYRKALKQGDTKRLSSVPYRAAFVGANLIAELLLAISSKGHGEGVISDESVKDSVYASAAELIVQQPKEQREYLISHVAGFLQQPQVLAEAYEKTEKELREQVAYLEKNPWVCDENGKLHDIAVSNGAHSHKCDMPKTAVHPVAIAAHGPTPALPLHA
jgi:hypothetical protein